MQRTARALFSIILLLCLVGAHAAAQSTVLVRGKINNNSSNQKLELTFSDESGKIVRASSASDGSYQTVLKPGHAYKVSIMDENLRRFTFSYEIPPMSKYAELTHDFTLEEAPKVATQAPTTKTKKKTKAKKSTKGK